jgi:hypothetical protein
MKPSARQVEGGPPGVDPKAFPRTWRFAREFDDRQHLAAPSVAILGGGPVGARNARLPKAARQRAAKDLFNLAWVYMRKKRRTAAEDQAMLDAAHGSRHFWREFATPSNDAISEWQLSRVYALVGDGARSMAHAKRALSISRRSHLEAWQVAFAFEACARAAAVSGDRKAALANLARARQIGGMIDERDDRDHFFAQLKETERVVRRAKRGQ